MIQLKLEVKNGESSQGMEKRLEGKECEKIADEYL